uniref:Uncharacterized protein n=1 Tax=Tanacetum cinerariifolium TaxID=118510 RepID=A0A6L2MRM6_TANCI|nr:hypothetical protein [Tanacetum cinerariifolium]
MTKPTMGGYMEMIREELRANTLSGTNDEDVVDHIAKVLEILDLIKIPNVDPDQLRLHVFAISLSEGACKWWNDETDGTVTTWVELTDIFHKYYPLSSTGMIVFDDEDGGPDYLDFVNWMGSKFRNHRRMDRKTKNTLWEFWIKGGNKEILMYDIELSDDEWEESNNTNANADLFFKLI